MGQFVFEVDLKHHSRVQNFKVTVSEENICADVNYNGFEYFLQCEFKVVIFVKNIYNGLA